MKMHTNLNLFVFACIILLGSAELNIYEPEGFRIQWPGFNQSTEYSFANYGDFPWGNHTTGHIGLADPLDACSPMNLSNRYDPNPTILIAKRANCNLFTKSRNAEQAGVKLLLVVGDLYDTVDEFALAKPAGENDILHIATVLISKNPGLIDIMQTWVNQKANVTGMFDFAIPRLVSIKENYLYYHLWLTNANSLTMQFLKDFKKYYELLDPYTIMKIHYPIPSSNDSTTESTNCICSGKYCSPPLDEGLKSKGGEVVVENLRQICILDAYYTGTWWNYIMAYDQSCLQSNSLDYCSSETFSNMQNSDLDSSADSDDETDSYGIESYVDSCMRQSFEPSSYFCESNNLLEDQKIPQDLDVPFIYSMVTIGNFTYRGNLVPAKGVFDAICNSFIEMPEECKSGPESIENPPILIDEPSEPSEDIIIPSLPIHFNISEPFDLQDWWIQNSQAVQYSLTPFGDIPWGSQVAGNVDLANPLDACSIITFSSNGANSIPPIMIAVQGNCSLEAKLKYAEAAGAKLLLIVNNQSGLPNVTSSSNEFSEDKQQHETIKISNVIVSKEAGEKLIEAIKEKRNTGVIVSGTFDFTIPKQDTVYYHLWLTGSKTSSFEFLKDFKKYFDLLSSVATMEIHFPTSSTDDEEDRDCLCQGKYCSPALDEGYYSRGAVIVLESVVQLCIMKQYGIDTWWNFIMEYDVSCLQSTEPDSCTKLTLSDLNVEYSDINSCVQDSFDTFTYYCSSNTLLDDHKIDRDLYTLFNYPSVQINDLFFSGNIIPAKRVFEAICNSFTTIPEVCRTYNENPNATLSQPKPVLSMKSDLSLPIGFNITEPSELKTWWTQNSPSIQYSLADFGNIPWGKEISSSIYLTNPLDACSSIRSVDDSGKSPYIMVSVRGGCEFSVKARNADAIGAQMLLIVDDQYEDVESVIITDTHEGKQQRIKVPTVLISREEGEKLIEVLRGQRKQKSSVTGTFKFGIVKNETVKYQLWLSSWDASSFQFLKDFKRYHEKLSDFVTMEFHFTRTHPDSPASPECICGGKYCSKAPVGSRYNSGPAVTLENLRQLCIIKDYSMPTWWDYIMNFNESTLTDKNITEYSNTVLSKIGVDTTDIDWCVRGSFDQYNYRHCKLNTLLENQNIVTDDFPLPTVQINDFFYRGNLIPARGVFEALCHSFVEEPEICRTYHEEPEALLEPKELTNNLPSSTTTSIPSPAITSSSSPESPIEATVNEAPTPKQDIYSDLDIVKIVTVTMGIVIVSLAFCLYIYVQRKGKRTQTFYQAHVNESEMLDTPKIKDVSQEEAQEQAI